MLPCSAGAARFGQASADLGGSVRRGGIKMQRIGLNWCMGLEPNGYGMYET